MMEQHPPQKHPLQQHPLQIKLVKQTRLKLASSSNKVFIVQQLLSIRNISISFNEVGGEYSSHARQQLIIIKLTITNVRQPDHESTRLIFLNNITRK